MGIVVAVIAFAVMVFIHELGHFSAAKLFKIKVTEFAIGMGPAETIRRISFQLKLTQEIIII